MTAEHESDLHHAILRSSTRSGVARGAAAGAAVGALSRRPGTGALVGSIIGGHAGRSAGHEHVLRDVVREERGRLKSEAKKTAAMLQKLSASDILHGGYADGIPASKFPAGQLAKGRKVEAEHTDCPEIAEEIARDHLKEDPKYYTHLAKMESQNKVAWAALAAKVAPALTNLGSKVVSGVGRGVKAVGGPAASKSFGGLVSKGVQASGGQQKLMRNVGAGVVGAGALGAAYTAGRATS